MHPRTHTPGLVPAGLQVAPLLERVRQQLHHETDYRAEAGHASAYRALLGDDPVPYVPAVVQAHCTDHILATEFVAGIAVDRLAQGGQPQAWRDHVALALARLSVREVFDMRLVQTDPNFGNYLFDATTVRVALIDFGVTESVAPERVEQLRELGRSLRAGDKARIRAASLAVGCIAQQDPPAQTQAVLDMMWLAGDPLRQPGVYDFGASELFGRVFEQGRAQMFGEDYARTPPPDLLFLQRKFIGTFMLCSRMQARPYVGVLFCDHF